MTNFSFNTTKSIINELGATRRLGQIAAENGITRALLVTDQGIVKAGILALAEDALKKVGVDFCSYVDVTADPSECIVREALALAKESCIDGVIGLGGGSSMDVAKVVAHLAISSQSLEDIYGIEMAKGRRLPLVQVPTTAGTGSEVTPIAIITTGTGQKMAVVASHLLPDVAVLDAELTLGLPPKMTAATGIDAMVHAIEAYTTKLKKNPISTVLACKALQLLMNNIRTAVSKGDNLEARSNMLLGSMLAGQAFANAPCSAIHALAYPIGGHFHIPHGLSNSLTLPHVMRFNIPCAAKEYAELARLLLPDLGNANNEKQSSMLIVELERLIEDIGLERRLSQVGIGAEHFPMMAEDAMKQQRLLANNPREMTYSAALQIYQQAG